MSPPALAARRHWRAQRDVPKTESLRYCRSPSSWYELACDRRDAASAGAAAPASSARIITLQNLRHRVQCRLTNQVAQLVNECFNTGSDLVGHGVICHAAVRSHKRALCQLKPSPFRDDHRAQTGSKRRTLPHPNRVVSRTLTASIRERFEAVQHFDRDPLAKLGLGQHSRASERSEN